MNAITEIPLKDEKLFYHKKQLVCFIKREKHVSSFFARLPFRKRFEIAFQKLERYFFKKIEKLWVDQSLE